MFTFGPASRGNLLFRETFVDLLTPYTLVSGSLGLFSAASGDYVNVLTVGSQTSGTPSVIQRVFPAGLCTTISVLMRIDSVNADDSAIPALFDSGTQRVSLIAVRESASDGSRRAFVNIGGSFTAVSSAALPVSQWLLWSVTLNTPGLSQSVITRVSDGVVLHSGTFAATAPQNVSAVRWFVDSGLTTGAMSFADFNAS